MGKKTLKLLLSSIFLIMLLCMIKIVVPIPSLLKYLPFFEPLMKCVGLNSFNASTMLFISFSIFLISYFFKKIRVIAFNLGFLLLVLASIEIFYNIKDTWFSDKHSVTEKHIPGYWHYSQFLGYTMEPNFVDHCIGSNCDSVIYDVKYTSDQYGFRRTPEIISNNSTKSIVFFGCSFTFGAGLNDTQVLPNIVGELVKNNYKVYNFALMGYGTQHMLTLAEFNMIDTMVSYEPKIFIYAAINDHVNRIIANYNYCRIYQKYEMNPITGEPQNIGRFDKNPFSEWIRNLGVSRIFEKIRTPTDDDVKLFGAMVFQSKKLLQKKYPNSEFHVLFWDFKEKLSNEMIEELNKRKITTHLVTNIIPDYINNRKSYHICLPYETHPKFKTNQLLANYIVTNIIKTPIKDSVILPEKNLK